MGAWLQPCNPEIRDDVRSTKILRKHKNLMWSPFRALEGLKLQMVQKFSCKKRAFLKKGVYAQSAPYARNL